MSKIISEKLKRLMEKFISFHQEALFENRWIVENTVVAQEVVHKVRQLRGKNGLMVLKVDMKKAYDMMEWSFISRALEAWGISVEVKKFIFSCVHGAGLYST